MSKFFKNLFKCLLLLFIVAIVGAGIYVWTVIDDAPTVTTAQLKAKPNPEGQRTYIKAKAIPQRYRDAVVSTEDATFETNNGINTDGLRALIESNIKALFGNGVGRGGSSITQQLVKLTAFQNNAEPTPKRKIQELYLALKINRAYSKDQIFEFYVNKIFEGYNRYGAETIAKFYYHKSLNQLSLDQQATIAGLGQSPTTFNLYTNQDTVKKRRNIVLAAMANNNKISKKQYNQAVNTPITHGLAKNQ
ncbi:penicillin-binding protein 1A [Weissella uvarum]|uniref:transglycosylase domain-containing protein n=1 Tax=Weissella uvarum TaxID=1479233 RepID=UPI00195F75C3|nr:transglycosylase domain-containing protein [Weissella uvarum]MBM7616928.1 penicillin-binding protein 1A [Weissella uvarum]MCM0594621.1 transglycosylase domain-containing protein [Weissella uvarum]